jgi:hypothetical protein
LNYHAGARHYPVSDTSTTFAVWTTDWIAAPNDDTGLTPMIHQDVFQKGVRYNKRSFFGGNPPIIKTW